MQLKLLAAALIIAGLLDKLAATAVTAPAAGISIPGAEFIPSISKLFKLGTGSGSLQGYTNINNVTAWQPITGENFGAITQTIASPGLVTNFNKVDTRFGIFKTGGQLGANIGDNVYNLTLTATSVNGTCQITTTVQLQSAPFNINLNTSALAPLIQVQSVIIGAISDFFGGFLTALIPPLIQNYLSQILPTILDFNQLCPAILNATQANFPQPIPWQKQHGFKS